MPRTLHPARSRDIRRNRRFGRPAIEALEPRVVLSAFGLDTTFNGTGTALAAFTSTGLHAATPVAVQADGRVVVAASTVNAAGNGDFVVERFTPSGVADSSFGTGGRVTIGFDLGGDNNDAPGAITVGADGKIVVAGTADNATGSVFALARLNSDGSLDTTFGTGGTMTLASPNNISQSASLVSTLPDGRILVGGSGVGPKVPQGGMTSQNVYYDLARLNVNGSADPSFGTQGTAQLSAGTGGALFSAGAEFAASAGGPDGRVVVLENSSSLDPLFGSSGNTTLSRFNADGSIDTGFDPNLYSFAPNAAPGTGRNLGDFGDALAIGPDDSVYVAGASGNILRVSAAGAIDPSYGTNRLVALTYPGAAPLVPTALAVLPDGRVVVAGTSSRTGGQSTVFNLAVLLPNGKPDPAFGAPGEPATASFPVGPAGVVQQAQALAVGPGGQVVVAGLVRQDATGSSDIGVARLLPIAGPSALTPDEAFVGSLYTNFLGRVGSLAELDAYVAKLPSLGRAGVVASVAGSPEHASVEVNALYQTLLGRAADPGGLTLYTAEVVRGTSLATVAGSIISSPEYYAHAGTTDPVQAETNDLAFVRSLYTNLLGRMPSDSELSAEAALLPTLGRDGLARAFLGSPEYRSTTIGQDYQTYLGRTPSAAEVAFYAGSAIPLDAIPLVFAGSAEFYARA